MLKLSAWHLNFNMLDLLHQNHVKLIWVIMWLPNQEYVCPAPGHFFKCQSWWNKKIMFVRDMMMYCPFGGFPYYVYRCLKWGFMFIYIFFAAFNPRIKAIRSVQTQILYKFDVDEQLNEVKSSMAYYWQLWYQFSMDRKVDDQIIDYLSQVTETSGSVSNSELQADLVSIEAKEEVAPAAIKVYFVQIFWINRCLELEFHFIWCFY